MHRPQHEPLQGWKPQRLRAAAAPSTTPCWAPRSSPPQPAPLCPRAASPPLRAGWSPGSRPARPRRAAGCRPPQGCLRARVRVRMCVCMHVCGRSNSFSSRSHSRGHSHEEHQGSWPTHPRSPWTPRPPAPQGLRAVACVTPSSQHHNCTLNFGFRVQLLQQQALGRVVGAEGRLLAAVRAPDLGLAGVCAAGQAQKGGASRWCGRRTPGNTRGPTASRARVPACTHVHGARPPRPVRPLLSRLPLARVRAGLAARNVVTVLRARGAVGVVLASGGAGACGQGAGGKGQGAGGKGARDGGMRQEWARVHRVQGSSRVASAGGACRAQPVPAPAPQGGHKTHPQTERAQAQHKTHTRSAHGLGRGHDVLAQLGQAVLRLCARGGRREGGGRGASGGGGGRAGQGSNGKARGMQRSHGPQAHTKVVVSPQEGTPRFNHKPY